MMVVNHNKFSLKCSNEYGMVSVIDFDCLKTDVSFGFSPDVVTYLGRVDREDLLKSFVKS